MKYRIIVCDDEEMIVWINTIAIEEIAKKLKIDTEIVGFRSGEEVIAYSAKTPVDIALLDIDMQGMNGIAIAVQLKRRFPNIKIIFITSHKEFALSAFEVEAMGYLIKPIDPVKLERQLRKAVNMIILTKNAMIGKTLLITEENVKKKIPQYKIKFIEKERNRCVIYTVDSTHYTYCSISKLLEELEDCFWQINQGVIVNKRYICEIMKNEVILKGDKRVTLGRKFAKEVKERYYTK